MMAKPLYVICADGGDGSYYPKFTLSTKLVEELKAAAEDGRMHYDNGIGVDGDGFHYTAIMVPDDATYESLGIQNPIRDDFADRFKTEEDED